MREILHDVLSVVVIVCVVAPLAILAIVVAGAYECCRGE